MATVHSDGAVMQHYFMGAYTFSSKPPFEITRISREPIFGKGMYDTPGVSYPTYKPIRCVFPSGLYIDEDRNEINVVFGKQDYESWLLKLDLNMFLTDNLMKV